MSLVNQQWEFLQDVCALIEYAKGQGFILTGGELYRTKEQQQIYVKKGLSKTLDGLHLDRLAIDLNVFVVVDGKNRLAKAEEIKPLGLFWESLDPQNKWGGNFMIREGGKLKKFIDAGHFERRRV